MTIGRRFSAIAACAVACLSGGTGVAAPDATMISSDIYDYLVMNVCVDAQGTAIAGNPMTCARQRNVRPGDLVGYVHADYPASPAATGCRALGMSRRYAFPLRTTGTDERGVEYPLIAAWTDYPPAKEACGFGTFDARDTATLLAVGPNAASLVGAHHHGQWFLTVGKAYLDPKRAGVSRFMDTWSFPRKVPPPGQVGWGLFPRRTEKFAAENISAQDFPPSNPRFTLTPTIQFWKHIAFRYGLRNSPSRPISTLLHIPFTKVAETGDAPGESRGSEHFYLTRELGYVTRWESWARDDARKDVMAFARKAYATPACTIPATIEGQVTKHVWIGQVVDDASAGVFRQQIITTGADGRRIKHDWFLTGCHDFTNVSAVKPYDLSRLLDESSFGTAFMTQFRAMRR